MESPIWQWKYLEMKERGIHLFKSKLLSDCSFKTKGKNGAYFVDAHKLVLAMSSPVFADILYRTNTGKEPIPIENVSHEVFEILLEYIYTDNLKLNPTYISDLYFAAEKYKLPYVQYQCLKFMRNNLTPENVCKIYESISRIDENIKDACLEMFKKKTQQIITDSNFCSIKLSTLEVIFSLDSLNIESEADLFEAAVRHADWHSKNRKEVIENILDDTSGNEGSSAMRSKLINETNDLPNKNEDINMKISDKSEAQISIKEDEDQGVKPLPDNKPYYANEHTITVYAPLMQKIRFLTLSPLELCALHIGRLVRGSAWAPLLARAVAPRGAKGAPPPPLPKGYCCHMAPRNMSTESANKKNMKLYRTLNDFGNLTYYESRPFYHRAHAWTLIVERQKKLTEDKLFVGISCIYEKEKKPCWLDDVHVYVKIYGPNNPGYSDGDFFIPLMNQEVAPRFGEEYESLGFNLWSSTMDWRDFMNKIEFTHDKTVKCKIYLVTEMGDRTRGRLNAQCIPASPTYAPQSPINAPA